MPALTILIQHRITKKLLKTHRTWVQKIPEARSFPTALSAFYFAAEHRLRDVEVVCVTNETTRAKQVAVSEGAKVEAPVRKRSAAPIPARYAEWPETVVHRHHPRAY